MENIFKPTKTKILATFIFILGEFLVNVLSDGISDYFITPALAPEALQQLIVQMTPMLSQIIWLGVIVLLIRYLIMFVVFYILVCFVYSLFEKDIKQHSASTAIRAFASAKSKSNN